MYCTRMKRGDRVHLAREDGARRSSSIETEGPRFEGNDKPMMRGSGLFREGAVGSQ